jgi:hypothetical protein
MPFGWTPPPAGMVASPSGTATTATATAAPAWGPSSAPPPPGRPAATGDGPNLAGQAIGIVVAVVVGLAAIGGVAWFVLRDDGGSSDALASSSSETLPPVIDLVPATSPDGSYSIGFPGQPDHPDSLPAPDPGQTIMGWSENNAFDPSASRGYLVISQPWAAEAAPIHQQMGLDAIGE